MPTSLNRIISSLMFVLMLAPLQAWAQTDSLYLEGTTLTARRAQAVAVPSAGNVVVDVSKVKTLPSLFGSADPVTFAHYLPSMTAQTELETGLHIQGNDHSHNMVSSGGVPIYGATHLLGLFSVFNPSHFGKMDYSTANPTRNRIGGVLDMRLPLNPVKKFSAELSAGLMAGQATFSLPVGSRASVTASARRSYLNLLYGSFLSFGTERTSLQYGFSDLNVTGIWAPSAKDRLWLDVYWGNDGVDGDMGLYSAIINMRWGNLMAALHWEHSFGDSRLRQSVYLSDYSSRLGVEWTQMNADVPSWIRTCGYRATWDGYGFSLAAESAFHTALPQSPTVGGSYNNYSTLPEVQQAWENTLAARYSHSWGAFSLNAGLKGSLYRSPENSWFGALDPDMELQWNLYRGGILSARVGAQHQYLFQTGMTDIGLPVEFWFLAGKYAAPQSSLGGSLAYSLDFMEGMYSLSAECYYKLLSNQIEYKSNLMELASTLYSMDAVLLHGNGRAFGVNLSLSKVSGKLTGWISYAWGRSLRSFDNPDYPDEYPAGFERIHELDAVVSYNLGRWTLGATCLLASGVPFTAPEYLYYLSGRVLAQFGPHNGARMSPYFRTDVSATYLFRRGLGRESGLTLSVYNITGNDNEAYYRFYVSSSKQTFSYGGVQLNIKYMPSISYFCKF